MDDACRGRCKGNAPKAGLTCNARFEVSGVMRVLYIDIDSQRPDHLGCYGYHRKTSPNIDAIARDAVRFDNVYITDAPCLPSRTALWSGRNGFHTGVVNHGGTAADPIPDGANRGFRNEFGVTGWMRLLRDLGYYTATVSSFGERHSAYHWYAGYNEILNCGKGGLERADEVAGLALGWLVNHAKRDNWFLHVNFWDPHTPYNTPEEFGYPFKDEPLGPFYTDEMREKCWSGFGPHSAQEPQHYDSLAQHECSRMPTQIDCAKSMKQWIDGYDTGILYMDTYLGRIFNALSDAGVLDETIIVIGADHGENLGELNVWGDHQTADAITCRVPLIIRWPGITAGVNAGLHYHYDWAATLVDMLGRKIPGNWDGKSFAGEMRSGNDGGREFLVTSQGAWACQRAVRWDKYICIRTYHDGYKDLPDVMLFDLESDPHEQDNLAERERGLATHGLSLLERWLTEMMLTSRHNVDPMMTVLREGGPLHCRGHLPGYLERLRATGRAHHAERLAKRHAVSATGPGPF